MKVAFVTDDKLTIHPHFGRAQFYHVVTIENNEVVKEETFPRHGLHHNEHKEGDHHHTHNHDHGSMFSALEGCKYLVARGIGSGAINHAASVGISVILPDLKYISDAVNGIINGTITSNPNRLHRH